MAHIINASTFMIGAGDRVEQATPLIKIDSDGKITAEAVQAEGYVKGGTKTATKQLDTAEGGHITPSEEEQTPARAGEFLKADLVVLPIPSEYIIPEGTDILTENGEFNVRKLEKVLVSVNKGVDAPDVPQAVPSITVSDNGLITATAVQEGGLVPSGTKTSTKQLTTQGGKTITPTKSEQTAVEDNRYTTGAVKVAPIPSQYVVPSGTLSITDNGTYDVTEYSDVDVNIEAVESVGDYDLAVRLYGQAISEWGYDDVLMVQSGYYQVNYGAARHFENLATMSLIDVASANDTVAFTFSCYNNVVVKSSSNCTAEVTYEPDYDGYPFYVVHITSFSGDASVSILFEAY